MTSSAERKANIYDWAGKITAAGSAVTCGGLAGFTGYYACQLFELVARAPVPETALVNGAISGGLSIAFGAAAIGLARLKCKTVDNHNRGVIARMNGPDNVIAISDRWTPDNPNGGFSSGLKETLSYTPVTRSVGEDLYYAGRFLQVMADAVGASSRAGRRSSNKDNGKFVLGLIVLAGLVTAVSASAYLATQAVRMNFFRPEPNLLSDDALQQRLARANIKREPAMAINA